jgi:PBSX family phage terminase large subunit
MVVKPGQPIDYKACLTEDISQNKKDHRKYGSHFFLTEVARSTPDAADFVQQAIARMIEQLPRSQNPRDIATALDILWSKYESLVSQDQGAPGTFDLPAKVVAPSFQSVFLAIADGAYQEYELGGGRGSTKSSFISLCIIYLLMQDSDYHAVCLRKVASTLRDSVYAQMIWAIQLLGLEDQFEYKVSPMEITRTATGQKIYFRGTDDPKKLKSITTKHGYIGILWFEELDQFHGPEEIRSIRQSVIRGGPKATVFTSYNPPKSANNWVNLNKATPKPGRLVHHSTYKDVPVKWLGQPFVDEAEHVRQVSPDAYEHEYEGVANGSGGAVFDNVTLREITSDELQTFDRIYRGVDWGYYPDPWAYNEMHYDAARRTLYIYKELSMLKASNQETYRALLNIGVGSDDLITADSAEKKSVNDYKSWGLHCKGAIKGPGSVDYSIKWLQGLSQIIIDPVTAPGTAKEFTAYEYERTKDGEIVGGYPDRANHYIDAVRYAMETHWKRGGQ